VKSRELLDMIENMAKEKMLRPGTTKKERILENAKAADIVLTQEELKEIDTRMDQMDLKVFGGV